MVQVLTAWETKRYCLMTNSLERHQPRLAGGTLQTLMQPKQTQLQKRKILAAGVKVTATEKMHQMLTMQGWMYGERLHDWGKALTSQNLMRCRGWSCMGWVNWTRMLSGDRWRGQKC
jgi:hypothetical protein